MSFSIIGTGSAVPEKVVTNEDLSTFLETNDEWIRTRTGIAQRHISTTESVTDLAAAAAARALDAAGITAASVDLVICATIRGDYITPSLACMVAGRIGASCPALDINAACPGFLYALDVAAGYFARGRVRHVLVVAAEAMSRLTDWSDRSTCVLFGDGAAAAVLACGDGLRAIRLSARPDCDVLHIPHVQGNCPFQEQTPEASFLSMQGQEVYKFAVGSMCRDLEGVIADAGLAPEDINHVLPHQANRRIIEAAQSRLPIPRERYAVNIERYGNTSAVSIPLLLDELCREGKLRRGDHIAMCAFGGGLTSAACVLRWDI